MSILRRFGGPQRPSATTGPIVDWSEKALRARNASVHRFEPTGRPTVAVVGEDRFQDGLEIAAGGRTPDGAIRRSHLALLLLEPDASDDPAAVKVMIKGAGIVGYLTAADARTYRPLITLLAERGRLIGCDATLTGGWDRGRGDRGSFGVALQLGTSAELITSLWLADVNPPILPHPWVAKTVTFAGRSLHHLRGVRLDSAARELLAVRAGCRTWPRVTRRVDVCVIGDARDAGEDLRKAEQYEIDRVHESEFWYRVGLQLPLI